MLVTLNVQRQVAGLFVAEEQGATSSRAAGAGQALPHRARKRRAAQAARGR